MSLLLARDLTYIEKTRRQNFRPSRARQVLPVRGAPAWAQVIEHSSYVLHGEDPVLLSRSSQSNLPTPTIDKVEATISVHRFGMALRYLKHEIDAARRANTDLRAEQINANSEKSERFLERIAAGDLQTAYGIPGLLTNATLIAAVGTASAKTGGGTTWAAATFEELIDEIAVEIQGVRAATYGSKEANLVIMPEVCEEVLERRLHPFSSETAMTRIRKMFPAVTFISWHKCNLANVGGTGGRLVTMAAGESTARFIIPIELTEDTPVAIPFGEEVPQMFSTAGVLIEDTSAIRYLDGVS